MDFFKEHRCDGHDGEDFKQFQCNRCVGDLFVSSRVLCSMLRFVLGAFSTNKVTNCLRNECLEFDGDVQPPVDAHANEIEEPADEPASDILQDGQKTRQRNHNKMSHNNQHCG